jgi:hypothetical protein
MNWKFHPLGSNNEIHEKSTQATKKNSLKRQRKVHKNISIGTCNFYQVRGQLIKNDFGIFALFFSLTSLQFLVNVRDIDLVEFLLHDS